MDHEKLPGNFENCKGKSNYEKCQCDQSGANCPWCDGSITPHE